MDWSWPHLTPDVGAIAATIKLDRKDFRVEELLAGEPDGTGQHVWFQVERFGMTTREAARRVAEALGVEPREVGMAGIVDARATARQTFSLRNVDPERVKEVRAPGVRVLDVERRKRKLRPSHLVANRFVVRLRNLDPLRLDDLSKVLGRLRVAGVPNYFGPQRFGLRGNAWEVGRALLHEDFEEASRLIAGDPREIDPPELRRARGLFESGDFEGAAAAWPELQPEGLRLARSLASGGPGGTGGPGGPGGTGGTGARQAVLSIDKGLLRFYVSSYQSYLFNQVVAERIASLDQLLEGDLAWHHASGTVFRVPDPRKERLRVRELVVSPTGPLFGRRMSEPGGEPAWIEHAVLSRAGETRESFRRLGELRWRGARRPLRVPLRDVSTHPGSDEQGYFVELHFALPPGAHASTVIAEVCKHLLRDASQRKGPGAASSGKGRAGTLAQG